MTSFFTNAPSFKALLFLVFFFTFSTVNAQNCDNLTDGGIISGDESGCNNPIFDPSPILNAADATGGTGDLEYIWMKTTGDPNSPFNTWQVIPGATGASFDPIPITQTTYYGRCSRRSGCIEYVGETNFVVKSISCCNINAVITLPINSTICPKEPLVLSATGNGTGLNYLWEATGGNFDNPSSPTPTYTMMIPGTYTIKVTITMGDCMEMAETTVTVDNQLDVSIIANHEYININETLPLNNTLANTNATFQWSASGGNLSSTTTSNPTFTSPTEGTFQVYLTATNENGCSGMDTFDIRVGNCDLSLLAIAEDASCAGNDGSITLSTIGATGVVTYEWGQIGIGNTNNPTNLAPGIYTVTVTDAERCVDSTTVEVGTTSDLTLSPNIKLPNCPGDNTGQISIVVNGGTPNYSYNWSNGLPNSPDVNNLPTGTYDLTVTDANGCTTTGSYQIVDPSNLVLSTSSTDPNCGLSDGTATVVVSGGNGPYTYAWNDSANQQTATAANLAGGTYQVVVTDQNGCQNNVTIIVNPAPNSNIILSATTTNATCDTVNGAIDLSISGGIAPYTILWDNGIGNIEDPMNLAAGVYSVVVTDSTGCGATTTVVIGEEGAVSVSLTMTNISCNEGSDGSATATPNGGTAPYTYAWSNGINDTATLTGLTAGIYTVTVTDAIGCQNIASATLLNPDLLTVSATPAGTDCVNPNGSAVATVSGGTPGYTFQWNDANNQTTQSVVNLPPGDYTVVVTDANGCTASSTTTIDPSMGLMVTLATTNALCNGENSGAIMVNVANGTAPFSYTWNNFLPGFPEFIGLAQGTYEVTVTDANGCFGTASAKVHGADSLIVTPVVEDADCNADDGRARLDVTGGTAPYSYAWDAPLTDTTAIVTNLAPGGYSFTVTDANGCTYSDAIAVFRKTDCDTCKVQGGVISTTDTLIICAGDGISDNITINLTGNEGTNTSWIITDESLNILELPNSNVFNFDGAGFGTCYIWSVSYENPIGGLIIGQNAANLTGCYELSNNLIVVRQDCTPVDSCTITPGSITTSDSLVVCVGDGQPDSVNLNLTNGSGTFSNFLITNTNSTILDITSSPNYDFENTAAGICLFWNITYEAGLSGLTVGSSVNNLVGCYKLSNVITVIKQDCRPECTDFEGSVSINNPAGANICAKASVGLSTSPEQADFTYNWTTTGGNFDDSTSATPTYSMMMPGTYQILVTVTQGNCVTKDSTMITIMDAPELTLTPTDGTCGAINGSIATTVRGGTAPYTYVWSDSTIGNITNPINLVAGNYDLTVTDANGCSATGSSTINNGSNIIVSLTPTGVICGGGSDGSINSTITDGTAPYTYVWSDSTIGNIANPINLAAGNYDLTVTDANGCSATTNTTINDGSTITILLTPFNSTCGGVDAGRILSMVSGGTAPYSYNWSNGATTDSIINLAAGLYELTVTDANGCTVTTNTTINDGANINLTLTPVSPNCIGGNDGSISSSISGGLAPYTYNWSDSTSSDAINNLTAGDYALTVTDANGCTVIGLATVDEGATISLTLTPTAPLCTGMNDGSISSSVSGGTAPYTYNWSNGTNDVPTLTNLLAGNYDLTVTDTNGCMVSSSTTVEEGDSISVAISATNPVCTNVNDGSLTATPSGGTAPYVYNWSNGGNTANINNLAAGTYDVTITDDNGCSTSASGIITEPTPFSVNIISTPRDICPGESINFGAAPADTSLTYQWTATGGSFDDATSASPIYTMMMSGTYEIILTASNGVCIDSDTTTVTVRQGLIVAATLSDVICAGDSTGAISILATSDNEPITYTWDNGIGNIPNPTDLPTGDYNVTISDATNCTVTFSATIGEISNLSVSVTPTTLVCNGGDTASITATTTGGIAPITFEWSNGAGNVTTINNLTAGTYTVTATDAMGCTKVATTTITDPTPLFVNIVNSAAGDTICGGAPVNLTAIPSDTSLTYSWTASGGSFDDATIAMPVYTMMMPGTHEIILVISNGICAATDTTYITIGEGIDFFITQTDISCVGETDGSITVTANSSALPLTYTWDNGIGNIPNPTGLAAGTYNLTITDGNNCERTASVTISDAAAIVIGLVETNILCGGDSTGVVNALIVGGATPLSLAWGNGENGTSINNLTAGTYYLMVTDANGCETMDSVTITEPTPLTAITEGANVGCNDAGHAHVTVSGGLAPYTYLWNDANNQTTDTAFNLVAGVYNVTITDANGCKVVESVSILETDGITCKITVLNDIETFNGTEGQLGVTASGGSGNYTYSWNNGGIDSVITGLSTNTYIVTITDETGCVCMDTLRLLNPAILGDFVFEDTDSNGIQDVGEPGIPGVTLQVSGTTYYDEFIVRETMTDANGNYQFALPPGGYKVTVVDALGYNFTNQDVGGDDTIDSDFDPLTNMSQVVTLAPNDIDLSIDLGVFVSNVCKNVLLGGSIRRDETLCGPSGDPMIITNYTFPTGGMGPIEYLWLKSDITMDYYPGHPDWMEIPNSNAPDYDPGVITKTTYYIRCSRRKGCNSYPGETNIITKTIIDCAANPMAENLRTTTTEGRVELIWDGQIAYDNGNYIIERSTNRIDFKVAGTMESPISETIEEFHFMDETPNFGENYYRIKTVVPNMDNSYSNIAMAMIKPNNQQKVMVYPNPVQQELTIHFLEQLEQSAKVQIVNGFGQVMKSLELDTKDARHPIDISELPSGVYYLKFDHKDLRRLGQKIYKVEE